MANTEFEQFKKRLGKRIQELRIEKGYTQETLAAAIGMDRVSIGYIEQGIRAPKLSTLWSLCTTMQITLKDLFGPLS